MTDSEALRRPSSPTDLFVSFTWLALQGFGGVLAVTQRVLCDDKRWMTREQFLEMLAVGQVLPGPNVCNVALMVGDRFFGWRGAFAALGGMMAVPLLIVMALAVLYVEFAANPLVAAALRGMGAVAAGLIIGTALQAGAGAAAQSDGCRHLRCVRRGDVRSGRIAAVSAGLGAARARRACVHRRVVSDSHPRGGGGSRSAARRRAMTLSPDLSTALTLFGHFSALSLLAVGGAISLAPEMHRLMVGQLHLLTDSQFNASIAIAQAAPGPNVLFVAVLGYQAVGWLGAAATFWASCCRRRRLPTPPHAGGTRASIGAACRRSSQAWRRSPSRCCW